VVRVPTVLGTWLQTFILYTTALLEEEQNSVLKCVGKWKQTDEKLSTWKKDIQSRYVDTSEQLAIDMGTLYIYRP
jgi:hypothetical protein